MTSAHMYLGITATDFIWLFSFYYLMTTDTPSFDNTSFEPQHDKTHKMTCVSSHDSDHPAQTDQFPAFCRELYE